MANEKVKPTEREVRLAKVISGLSLGVDALLRHREKISEVLSEICEHIDESTEAAMVEMEGLNRDLRESMPELFSGVEEPAAEDSEDSEDSEPPLTKGQWVKVKKPSQEGTVYWNAECMDKYDGGIFRVYHISPDHLVTGGLVYLKGAPWSFDPAWLTPLPYLTEGWRYLQPDEIVAAGDECCALEYLRSADWWASGNVGRKQAAGGVYRRRIATEAPAEGKTEEKTEGEAVAEVAEAPEPSVQAEQITSSIFPDAPTRAWRDAVAKIISAPPSDGHLRTANGDRMFKIISWIVREVDFTRNLVWIDAHLRVLVPTHKDKQGEGDVYESLIFDKNLFDPQTDSPIIEYPKGGDLVSEDGPVYLANDWLPSLICDRPVEVTTILGVEFVQFDLPDAPSVVAVEPPAEPEAEPEAEAAEAPKPAWEPKKGDWVTITRPADGGGFGWVSPFMDEYDGQIFQFNGEFSQDAQVRRWAIGPGGYYFNLAWLSPAPAKVAVPEAPQKPVKAPVTAYHIGKQVLVTQRLKGFESSFVRILKGITTRKSKNRPDIVEYAVGRSPTDCFHDILYINPSDPDSEYQIEPLDD